MTIRKYIAAAIAATLALGAQAKVLSPDQALARAAGESGMRKAAGITAKNPRLVYTHADTNGEAALYVFSKAATNSGYTILSADDMAYPVLGYADNGDFDVENMPEAMKWWLSQYADQISYARKHAAAGSVTMAPKFAPAADRVAIEPMIKSDWDQGEPYNGQCPMYDGIRTYTGCVATAMAQVMKYWEYPEKGKGQISYTSASIQKRLSMNFAQKAFDWSNMLKQYKEGKYTEEQANAVAYLMKACGYAVKMDYGTDSSGALAMNIANALTKYFGYDGNIDYQLRQYHSSSDWNELMYQNLKNVGPILYGGASMIGGGHSFICDGYSTDGYFHFNWGWTGMSNGYFLLEGLNPYALGIGGGQGGGFNFTQDAVFGIQPPTGAPVVEKPEVLTQCGSLAAVVDGITIKFDLFAENDPMWVNYNPTTLKVKFGVRIEPADPAASSARYAEISTKRFSIDPGYGTSPSMFSPALDLAPLNLPDGTYKITIVTANPEEETDRWQDIKANYGYSTYVMLTRAGDKYTVDCNDVNRLSVAAASVDGGNINYGCTHRFTIKVVNDNDTELTSGFAPVVIYNNKAVMLGESIFVSLKPGESVERTWDTDLYLLDQYFNISEDTEVYLTFFDEATYNMYHADYFEKFVMRPNTGVPTLSASNIFMTDKKAKAENINGKLIKVYQLDENEPNVNLTTNISLQNGYCAYNVYACLVSLEVDENGNIAILNYAGHPIFISEVGASAPFSANLDLSAAAPGELYAVMMAMGYGTSLYPINGNPTYFRKGKKAGVEDVVADSDSSLTYANGTVSAPDGIAIQVFDISGALVASGNGNVDLSALAGGIYIARAGSESIKIAK